jgi:TatD family hydrolase
MTPFYDTHAHLDFPDFAGDLPETIERAMAAGISKLIAIGTDFTSSRRALALSREYPQVHAVVGWHPSHVTAAPDDVRPELRELAREPKVVAIGETGLDYHRLPGGDAGDGGAAAREYRSRQWRLFDQQLEVAAELGLNCVVHQRDAFDDVLSAMKPFAGKLRGVFHCFGGTPAQARAVMESGGPGEFHRHCHLPECGRGAGDGGGGAGRAVHARDGLSLSGAGATSGQTLRAGVCAADCRDGGRGAGLQSRGTERDDVSDGGGFFRGL